MAYEIEILSDRLDASSLEVWEAISYYVSIHLSEGHGTELTPHNYDHGDLRKTSLLATVYNGVYLEINFALEGSRQIWLGSTFAGDGPFARHEHVFGFIEVANVHLGSDEPVDVRIVCSWPPLYQFFLGLGRHLDKYFQSVIYYQGIAEHRQELISILVAVGDAGQDDAEILSLVTALRRWAAAVDRDQLVNLEGVTAAIDDLEKDPTVFGGTSGYLELNVPIIPKLLSYKWRIGVEAKPSLRELWNELRRFFSAG